MQFNIRGIARLPPSCGSYTSNWGTATRILVINQLGWLSECVRQTISSLFSLSLCMDVRLSSTRNIFEELKHFAALCVAGFLPSQHIYVISCDAANTARQDSCNEIGVSRCAYRCRQVLFRQQLRLNAGASYDVSIRTQMMSCFHTRWHYCLI